MKVMAIGIRSHEESMKAFAAAFEAAQKGVPPKDKGGVYFTSLEAVRNFLTPRRLDILHKIKQKNPRSIYELAKILKRSFPSVLRDVETLTRHGLVKLTKAKTARRSVHPTVSYDAINLWIGI